MSNLNYKKAKEILQALINGVDPQTGEELSHDTIVSRADCLRALLASVAAIESVLARNARRAQLPENVGREWTKDEEEAMTAAFKSGDAAAEIAEKHGRTIRAIEARLEKLGLLSREQRSTGDYIGVSLHKGRRKKE